MLRPSGCCPLPGYRLVLDAGALDKALPRGCRLVTLDGVTFVSAVSPRRQRLGEGRQRARKRRDRKRQDEAEAALGRIEKVGTGQNHERGRRNLEKV